MSVTVENGQVWRYGNPGTTYLISNIRLDQLGNLRCRIQNVDDPADFSENYRVNYITDDSSRWKFVKKQKPKKAKKYSVTYCAQGCGEVHLIKPGEEIKAFTCDTCLSLPIV